MENGIYHICTDGLAQELWFRDEEDYVDGMNSTAVCALLTDVNIYCFCLMSNHVHFIINGAEGRCIRFIREYKRRRTLQLAAKYADGHSLQGAGISMKRIDKPEYLKTVIAYVMRNPTAAGLAVVPGGYRWSSSNQYFADRSFLERGCRAMAEFSLTRKRKMFKTKIHFPDDYLIGYDGIIFPGSYVDYKSVEKIYNSPRQFLYHLSATNDLLEELETGILTRASYNDSELLASMEALCSEKFGGRKFGSLRIEDRYQVAREMRKRYGTGARQLARITSLDPEFLKRLL